MVDLGVAMTPTVGVMVRKLGAAGGLVLTASHNPQQWNGLKPITRKGHAPSKAEAEMLIERFYSHDATQKIRNGKIMPLDDAPAVHVSRVLEALGELYDLDAIRSARHRVLLNSVNASGALAGRMLLDELGCEVVAVHDEPSGVFPHTPEPTAENLAWMGPRIAECGAAVGFAQDPDGDRLAMLDGAGRYIGEEYTLALGVLAVLERMAPGSGSGGALVAANLSTSRMVDDIAARFGARVVRTPVGEANLVQSMVREGVVIGGEGNGGVVWPRVGLIRDSLVAMGLTLALLTAEHRTLAEVVGELPAYAIVKRKRAVREGLVSEVLDAVRRAFPEGRVNEEDGVRVDVTLHEGAGWVHGRASNTEPIVRLIAEAPTAAAAEAMLDRVETAMG